VTAIPNQFLLYDTAVADWATLNFGSILSDPTYLTVGTPDRAFAEYVTPTTRTPREGRPPLPRCAITLEDPVLEPERFNPNIIRKLGYASSNRSSIRRAYYPVPVKLPYTINFWTEKYREMNLFEQVLLKVFKFNYLQILVDIDSISPIPVYGKKYIELYAEGAVANTGDLEPSKGERYLRRTFNFHAKAWIWDLDIGESYSLKEVQVETYRDANLSLLFEVVRTPHRSTLVTLVNGVDTTFGPVSTDRKPIIPGTFLVDATVSSILVRGIDNGQGVIVDHATGIVSGTVDYSSGSVQLVYSSPPTAGTLITTSFYTSL